MTEPILRVAATQSQIQKDHEGIPYIVVPETHKVVDMENYMDRPTRIRQKLNFENFEDYIRYVKRFRSPTTSSFLKGNVIITIFDYHWANGDDIKPARCEHKAIFKSSYIEEFYESYLDEKETLPPIYHLAKK